MARPQGSVLPDLFFNVYEQVGGEFPLRRRGVVAAYDSEEAFQKAKKTLFIQYPVIEKREERSYHGTHH